MPDLGEFHFHLLRHTFTTDLLTNGAAPKDVQELLGHSDVGTTMNIYAEITDEFKAQQMASFNEFYQEATGMGLQGDYIITEGCGYPLANRHGKDIGIYAAVAGATGSG